MSDRSILLHVAHYSRAPITEALIEIQFSAPPSTATALAAIQGSARDAYPSAKPLFLASFVVNGQLTQDVTPSFSEQQALQEGWAFISEDTRQIWQVRSSAFQFSRLTPYQSWPPFSLESRRLWDLTRNVLQPTRITRIALRTINRFDLPLPFDDFKDFLLTVPEVSPQLPQGLSGFFMQLHMPQPALGAMVVLNQHLLPFPAPTTEQPQPAVASIIFDTDLFKHADLPQDEDGLWLLLEQFHRLRNEIFEGCITDRLRRLIE